MTKVHALKGVDTGVEFRPASLVEKLKKEGKL